MLIDCGAQDVQISVAQPVFRQGEGKQIAPITLAHIGPALLAARLCRPMSCYAPWPSSPSLDPHTVMSLPRVVQAWGRK